MVIMTSTNRPVLCFGEALIDLVNFDYSCEDSVQLREFRGYPGGAPANASVAVAKLGGNARFLGQVGNDKFGHFLLSVFRRYGVDVGLVQQHKSASTALAFVFLDDNGERSFEFYRNNTADVLYNVKDANKTHIPEEAIFHFCSNTLTTKSLKATTSLLVSKARTAGAVISFDVNLRHNLWAAGKADIALINELVQKADIAKFSLDELEYLSSGNHKDYINALLSEGVKLICVTDGGNEISLHLPDRRIDIIPPVFDVIDTTGGGDGFVGALLYGLSKTCSFTNFLADKAEVEKLGRFAATCGAITVSRYGAFPALPTLDEVKKYCQI